MGWRGVVLFQEVNITIIHPQRLSRWIIVGASVGFGGDGGGGFAACKAGYHDIDGARGIYLTPNTLERSN